MFAWNDENHPDGIKALKSAGLEFFQYIKTIDYKVLMSITSIHPSILLHQSGFLPSEISFTATLT